MSVHFFRMTCANKVVFFVEGEAYYNAYVDLIDKAQHSIHLQTYIFEMDRFGTRVHGALIRAASRGVKVHLLIDSVGSKEFSSADEGLLSAAHIHFYRFNGLHLRWFYQWGRRLHHKVLLVDHEKAIIGGINVTTSGYGQNDFGQQLDFAVGLEGPVIYDLSRYCQAIFKNSFQKKIPLHHVSRKSYEAKKGDECIDLKISINDWVYRRWQITKQYSNITKVAQKEIIIINSYFFPRRKFMKQLVAAVKRGVRVRLILPMLSDWPSYILASQFLYSYFLKNGIEIYQWKKSILHGKLATVDGQFATIGSFNLNYTSYQQNLEMNVDIYSKDFTSNLNEVIEEIIEVGCEKLDAENFVEKVSYRIRFLRFFFYILLSIIANFSVGLTYQEVNANSRSKYYNMFRVVMSVIFLILGIVGAILPVIPGFPFFVISFLLVYRQLLFNKELNV